MNVLLVVATPFEIAPLIEKCSEVNHNDQGLPYYDFGNCRLTLLVTGVGMVPTAFALGKHINSTYNFALNIGIAGSFSRKFAIGTVVHVNKDCFAELGAEDGDDFLTIDQLGFGTNTIINTINFPANIILENLPKVNGITVNKVHGNERSIEAMQTHFHPITESMEGAAFLFACTHSNIPCVQLRSISNYVEKRNREAWNIPLAIQNVNTTLQNLLLAF